MAHRLAPALLWNYGKCRMDSERGGNKEIQLTRAQTNKYYFNIRSLAPVTFPIHQLNTNLYKDKRL